MWKVVSIGSMVLQILGVVFAYFALVFGAISTYSIVFTASYLFSGMILMSYILGIEKKPNKDTRVGNCKFIIAYNNYYLTLHQELILVMFIQSTRFYRCCSCIGCR